MATSGNGKIAYTLFPESVHSANFCHFMVSKTFSNWVFNAPVGSMPRMQTSDAEEAFGMHERRRDTVPFAGPVTVGVDASKNPAGV